MRSSKRSGLSSNTDVGRSRLSASPQRVGIPTPARHAADTATPEEAEQPAETAQANCCPNCPSSAKTKSYEIIVGTAVRIVPVR